MKMKFTAAFALLAWLAVVGWLASMVIAKPAVLRRGNQAEDTAAMADLRNSITRNRQVMESMAALHGAAAPAYAGPAEVIALPVAAPAAVDGSSSGMTGDATTGTVAHAVSLVLIANGRRTAIVDGQSVRAGSRLDGGARVAAIGQDWVRIVDPAGNRQTYRVRDPLEPEMAGNPE
jgi:hypothetical protein